MPPDPADPFDLERFVEAQRVVHDAALDELRSGRKTGHWIWYVFPQVAGLGHSPMSRRYAIGSIEEARAYLAHPVLGPRLRECSEALLSVRDRSASEILGDIDARKVRSSMTLFARAAPDDAVFSAVLDRYYEGVADQRTDELLGA
jgi:uncharacterized protein (DUF1810 family)